jgi:hypothetical protein
VGDYFQRVVDVEATEAEAPDLAARVVEWLVDQGVVVAAITDCAFGDGHAPGPWYTRAVTETDARLLELRTNGLEVVVGRTVFFSLESGQRVFCPHCANEVEVETNENISSWYRGGDGVEPCPACGRIVGLNEWRWEPPWGFGYLGFTFWNWPRLRPDFVAEVAELLGHRVVLPYGKM